MAFKEPMGPLEALFFASFELGKLAKSVKEDGRIANPDELFYIQAILDEVYTELSKDES